MPGILGIPGLTRARVPALVSASLQMAYYGAEEPAASVVALAALGASCTGPDWWPAHDGIKPWTAYARDVQAALAVHGISVSSAVRAGRSAIIGLSAADTVTREELDGYADFFGAPRLSWPASASESGTAAAEPSTDSP